MWIEDLTKALYYLNATNYKYSVCIDKIINNTIFFSNGKTYSIDNLAEAYDKYIKKGELIEPW